MNPSQPVHTSTPGKALGIVGFILGFVGLSLIGLILSIIASVQSSKAGVKNGLAIAGIVTNSIFLVVVAPLMLITVVSYNGITSRANTNAALSSANTVLKYAEIYYADNGSYPTTFAETAVPVKSIELSKTALTEKPSTYNTITFSSCGTTGVKIGYWNYQTEVETYLYGGKATTSSTCTRSTE